MQGETDKGDGRERERTKRSGLRVRGVEGFVLEVVGDRVWMPQGRNADSAEECISLEDAWVLNMTITAATL